MDKNWVDYLSNMEQIKDSIWLVGYAQQDPFMVYREKAVEQYKITVQNIRKEIVSKIISDAFENVKQEMKQNSENIQKENKNQEITEENE